MAQDLMPWPRRSKYNARKVVIDGERFDSKREAFHWLLLRQREARGEIRALERQVRFDFALNGHRIGFYKADFRFQEAASGAIRVVDVKGYRTPMYRLKKKLLKAFYDIDIIEI